MESGQICISLWNGTLKTTDQQSGCPCGPPAATAGAARHGGCNTHPLCSMEPGAKHREQKLRCAAGARAGQAGVAGRRLLVRARCCLRRALACGHGPLASALQGQHGHRRHAALAPGAAACCQRGIAQRGASAVAGTIHSGKRGALLGKHVAFGGVQPPRRARGAGRCAWKKMGEAVFTLLARPQAAPGKGAGQRGCP